MAIKLSVLLKGCIPAYLNCWKLQLKGYFIWLNAMATGMDRAARTNIKEMPKWSI